MRRSGQDGGCTDCLYNAFRSSNVKEVGIKFDTTTYSVSCTSTYCRTRRYCILGTYLYNISLITMLHGRQNRRVKKRHDEPGYSSILLHLVWDRMGVNTIILPYYLKKI